MKIIGIEYTFDDLSISCVENGRKIKNIVTINTSNNMYLEYGGVIPTKNLENGKKAIKPLLKRFQQIQGINFNDIDMICYSAKPGFKSTIAIAKYIAELFGKKLNLHVMPIDHLEAHFFSIYINKEIKEIDNALYLIISGGNTKLYHYVNNQFKVVIETKDIAIGDMLDKLARKLNFQHAKEMDKYICEDNIEIKMPNIKFKNNKIGFSFSGLQTHFEKWIDSTNQIYTKQQQGSAIFKTTFNYLIKILESFITDNSQKIVLSGGVSASKHLRSLLLQNRYINNIIIPHIDLITDNGAMIASAAYFTNEFIKK